MGDHHDGGSFLAVDASEEFHDAVSSLGVEVAGGLISDDCLRVIQKCSCDGDTLLLAA